MSIMMFAFISVGEYVLVGIEGLVGVEGEHDTEIPYAC